MVLRHGGARDIMAREFLNKKDRDATAIQANVLSLPLSVVDLSKTRRPRCQDSQRTFTFPSTYFTPCDVMLGTPSASFRGKHSQLAWSLVCLRVAPTRFTCQPTPTGQGSSACRTGSIGSGPEHYSVVDSAMATGRPAEHGPESPSNPRCHKPFLLFSSFLFSSLKALLGVPQNALDEWKQLLSSRRCGRKFAPTEVA